MDAGNFGPGLLIPVQKPFSRKHDIVWTWFWALGCAHGEVPCPRFLSVRFHERDVLGRKNGPRGRKFCSGPPWKIGRLSNEGPGPHGNWPKRKILRKAQGRLHHWSRFNARPKSRVQAEGRFFRSLRIPSCISRRQIRALDRAGPGGQAKDFSAHPLLVWRLWARG